MVTLDGLLITRIRVVAVDVVMNVILVEVDV